MRIVTRLLPKKSPWLNAIEPKWIHGKRKVVEPAGVLGAYELAERDCAAIGVSALRASNHRRKCRLIVH